MKIILLSMPDITSMLMHHEALHIPNLGIASIGANIDEENEVYLIDLIRKRRKIKKYLTKIIYRYKPDLVGLSAMTWQYSTCIKIIKLIKGLLPKVKIAIGGYHATLMYNEIVDSEEKVLIDFIIRGEGEEVFRRLINAINGKDKFEDIKSLSYKINGKFIHNPQQDLLDLTKIKLSIRDKRRLTGGYHINMYRMEAMETSRGCTRSCNFCSIKHMYGKSFRTYPIERVLKDIDDIYYNKKTRWIFISDDNLVLNPKRVIELCEAIISRKYKNLNLFVQADCISMSKNEDMVKKMAEAGFRSIFLGIENVSSANLELMNKGNIVEATKKAIENCHKYGIIVIGGLIFGLPDDNEQSIIENYSFIRDVKADAYYCQIITPYPRTGIRESLINQELVTNDFDYKWYDGTWANVKTKYLSTEKLQYYFWLYRQKILGTWKPTENIKGKYLFWIILWKYIMSPVYLFFYNRSIKKYGFEGKHNIIIEKKKKVNFFKDLIEY